MDPPTTGRCERDPQATKIRDALLAVELEGHRAGWNQPPRAFTLSVHRETGRAAHFFFPAFDVLVRRIKGATVADRLDMLTEVLEERRAADNPPPGRDLWISHFGPDWAFYGWGMLHEAWGVLDEDRSAVVAALRNAGAFARHERRQEYRVVYFVGRDDVVWDCRRRRSDVPLIKAVGVNEPGLQIGGIPHLLSRLTAAVAGTPVTIIEDIDVAALDPQ